MSDAIRDGDKPPIDGRWFVWGIALILVAATVALFVFTENQQGRSDRFDGQAVGVRVGAVERLEFSDLIEAIGTARANESVTITARVSESVQTVNFEDGQWVEAGAVLVELTNSEELAQVSEAKANYREARQQYDRVADLVANGTVSRATLDERTREVEATRFRLSAAEARAADRVIRAPFAGLLGLRTVSPGALVSPGTAITTLDDITLIKVDFSIPERFMAALSPDQAITTRTAAFAGRDFNGIVRTVNSRVDPVTRSVIVRAEVRNDDLSLRPGLLMTVRLSNNQRTSLAVPEGALAPQGDEQFVYVMEGESQVRRIQVSIGKRQAGYAEITSGLSGNERIVVSGTMRLRDGAVVNVVGEEEARRGDDGQLSVGGGGGE